MQGRLKRGAHALAIANGLRPTHLGLGQIPSPTYLCCEISFTVLDVRRSIVRVIQKVDWKEDMARYRTKAQRPLSPHLQVYRFTMTMMMSIAHRVVGGSALFRHFFAGLVADRGGLQRALFQPCQ